MNILECNRIMIVGNNSSGKSFLAKELSTITGLPLIHLDAEFWYPNWKMPSENEWLEKNEEFVAKEKWIIDGMCSHGGTMELRFGVADLIIFLDINYFVCLAGVIKRNGKKRSDTAAYQYENFDIRFIRFCKEIWNFPKTRKHSIMNLHKKYNNKPFLTINRRRKMGEFLIKWKNKKIQNITCK